MACRERRKPNASVIHLLDVFLPLLADLHRPRRMFISWGEYNARSEQIDAYEDVEVCVEDWDAIRRYINMLEEQTENVVGLMSLFIELDTSIVDAEGEAYCPQSATFQLSMTPPWTESPSVWVIYITHIDVWLSTTYGPCRESRSNRDAARLNRPRLADFLVRLAVVIGPSFRPGLSQTYPFAITPTGFSDVDELPPLASRNSAES